MFMFWACVTPILVTCLFLGLIIVKSFDIAFAPNVWSEFGFYVVFFQSILLFISYLG